MRVRVLAEKQEMSGKCMLSRNDFAASSFQEQGRALKFRIENIFTL